MWQCQSVTHLPTFWFWNTKRHPRHLWPLRHLIRVMRKLDLTNKKTMTKTITNTLSEHNQMTILEKLWNYWYFWQLRTSRHYNHSDLTIKTIQSDTGQHSQFMWWFTITPSWWTIKMTITGQWWLSGSGDPDPGGRSPSRNVRRSAGSHPDGSISNHLMILNQGGMCPSRNVRRPDRTMRNWLSGDQNWSIFDCFSGWF